MARTRMIDNFREAEKLGPYDEYPVLLPGIDPQMHLSRNDRPQPFFLICGKDSLLVQMSGNATLQMKHPDVINFHLKPGDYVYVPAGMPHRLVPDGVCINQRYKAESAGLEAVAWYCPKCQSELHRSVWETHLELPQEGYARATAEFNASTALRTCKKCGSQHAPIDMSPFRWLSVAQEIRESLVKRAV
jgi:hypothetical protein